MRLQQKALIVTLPLILVPTIVLGWLSYHYTIDAQIQIENAKLQADVAHRSNALSNYVVNAQSALKYLSNSSDIKLLQTQFERDMPYTLAQEFIVESFEAFSASYTDTESIILYAKDYKPIFGYQTEVAQKPLTEMNKIRGELTWRLLSENRESPKVEIQLPLLTIKTSTHPGGFVWGYIQLIMKPQWQSLLDLHHPENANSFMISTMEGRLLYTYPANEVGTELPKQLFARLLDSARYEQASNVSDGNQRVFFTGDIVDEEYLLLYGINEANVMHQESNITWFTIVVVLASVVVAPTLLFYAFSRTVIQPIERLASAKQQVAQGKLDVKLGIPAKDELGELFAAFNVMVRQLVVYRENERESRLRLEYKVKERTEELEATNTALGNSNKALEAAKQLSEQANELKSAFVANISHEIRTPLTAILGFTEQVIADMPSSKYQMDLLARVLKSGKHLLALINDILDLSKIESNKLDLELEQIDVFDLFNDVISILSAQAAEKNLEFEFNQHYPLPRYIRTDATRLRQILLNLASNAIKFTEKGFIHIDLRYKQETDQIEVTVSDSGIGMSDEIQQRIFAPFVQADVSISRKFGGTGLGLVISKSLSNMLGGDIKVFSEEGKGSEFVVDFATSVDGQKFDNIIIRSLVDLAQADLDKEKAKAKAPKRQRQVANLNGRVLIAEDVEDNQYLFGLLLKSVNVKYDIVENGQLAVEKALTEDFDLILMDMQMPIMGGLEATQLLRQAGIETPIYALTANVMKEDVDKHVNAGCNGTIAKPIEKTEFYKVLSKHLAESEKTESQSFSIPAEQMAKLKRDYLLQLAEQRDLLTRFVVEKNLEGLKAECHKIKGSAGSYGFNDLSNIASNKEVLCKEQLQLDIVNWPILEDEFGDFFVEIDAVLSDAGAVA